MNREHKAVDKMNPSDSLSKAQQELDKILIEHNQYIDNVWRGKADLDNPPKTAQAISDLIKREVRLGRIEELETLRQYKTLYPVDPEWQYAVAEKQIDIAVRELEGSQDSPAQTNESNKTGGKE